MKYEPKRAEITMKDLAALLPKMGPMMIAEFRGHTVERIDYLDSKTGKPTHFIKATAAVEVGEHARQVVVDVRLPKEVDSVADVVSLGAVKGQTVLLRLTTIKQEKGNTTASIGSEDSALSIVKG